MARGHGRAAFAFIFVTVVIDMLALGVIVPVLPKLIVAFRGGDTASGATYVGIFGTVFAAMQFLFSPVLGSLSDQYGRRRVILLSCAGLGLDYLLMASAPSLWWLFVGRVISGITSSTYGTASAYIADVTPPEQRAAKFGMLGVAFGVGFIIGPSVGGLLAGISLRAPFWGAALLCLANAAYGYFVLPESLPEDRRSPFRWTSANPAGALALLRSHPQLFALAVAGFLSMLAHDAAPSTFVLYTSWRYGWNERTIGLVLALVGVTSMIVQGGLVGRIVSALGEKGALAFGLLCGAVGNAVFGLAPTGTGFLIGIPITAFYGLANPALQSLMTRRVSADEQGRLQGAVGSLLMGMTSMLAPVLFTQAFAAAIGPYLGWGIPGAPFLIAALLLVGAAVVAFRAVAHPSPATAEVQ
ncbi:MAG: TCR/Tet family MFS transporter [Acidobacteria bacterium]|nr:TCR/Tet family MFS transporter [Acidobacteriota bacterium]